MKDGLYEGVNGFEGYFFACKNNENTIWYPSKSGAINALAVNVGAPTEAKQKNAKWIAPLYPADGIWKIDERFFAIRGNKTTASFESEGGAIDAINRGDFSNKLGSRKAPFEYISTLPTSRVKLISGEYILTLDPPKSDFDVYVKRFGFYNEVYVEDVIRFARENHPCWEPWLLKHGIPFEEEIGVGDIVEVVDDGKRYPSYAVLAEILGAKRFIINDHHKIGEDNGKKGRVVAIEEEKIALVDIISEEILVGVEGLRRLA
jgi:hypothetical protein